ncbi:MAG TPA: hypothetical protein DDW23_05730 [Planctomycetes bacterium]|nr:hypothetical protein [Planctomycetota bacterium]
MWNGEEPNHSLIRSECAERGIPCSILEVGYFPQKSYFTIDPAGINATSSLMEDDLKWIGPKELEKKEALRKSYLKGRRWKGKGDYILVPLQLKHDTNIRNNSEFLDMQQFIDFCEQQFPGKNLLFKRHPEDAENYKTQHTLATSGDFLDLAMNAEAVIGINSTCLLESTLLGVPTEGIGKGFLSAHADNSENLLAALVDKQVPVNAKDMSYWINRYCATSVENPKR